MIQHPLICQQLSLQKENIFVRGSQGRNRLIAATDGLALPMKNWSWRKKEKYI